MFPGLKLLDEGNDLLLIEGILVLEILYNPVVSTEYKLAEALLLVIEVDG